MFCCQLFQLQLMRENREREKIKGAKEGRKAGRNYFCPSIQSAAAVENNVWVVIFLDVRVAIILLHKVS